MRFQELLTKVWNNNVNSIVEPLSLYWRGIYSPSIALASFLESEAHLCYAVASFLEDEIPTGSHLHVDPVLTYHPESQNPFKGNLRRNFIKFMKEWFEPRSHKGEKWTISPDLLVHKKCDLQSPFEPCVEVKLPREQPGLPRIQEDLDRLLKLKEYNVCKEIAFINVYAYPPNSPEKFNKRRGELTKLLDEYATAHPELTILRYPA